MDAWPGVGFDAVRCSDGETSVHFTKGHGLKASEVFSDFVDILGEDFPVCLEERLFFCPEDEMRARILRLLFVVGGTLSHALRIYLLF